MRKEGEGGCCGFSVRLSTKRFDIYINNLYGSAIFEPRDLGIVARMSHLCCELNVSGLKYAKRGHGQLLVLEDYERRAIIKIATTLLAQLVAGLAAPSAVFAD